MLASHDPELRSAHVAYLEWGTPPLRFTTRSPVPTFLRRRRRRRGVGQSTPYQPQEFVSTALSAPAVRFSALARRRHGGGGRGAGEPWWAGVIEELVD
jgi:hypothetical protein